MNLKNKMEPLEKNDIIEFFINADLNDPACEGDYGNKIGALIANTFHNLNIPIPNGFINKMILFDVMLHFQSDLRRLKNLTNLKLAAIFASGFGN